MRAFESVSNASLEHGHEVICISARSPHGKKDPDMVLGMKVALPSELLEAVVGPHDQAVIFGGRSDEIQQDIACGHSKRGTPSGGPHFALATLFGFLSPSSSSEKFTPCISQSWS